MKPHRSDITRLAIETGAPQMTCAFALRLHKGDIVEAAEWLRKSGTSAGRTTEEILLDRIEALEERRR